MSVDRSPTPEQAEAISRRGNLLIEAGAGTGKTGVMVERYCRLVCDEEVSPDAVLAVTFTDKAAAELRQRIRAALSARAAAGSDRAGSLLEEIGGAWVTTIHGFCNRLLAGHPVAAGVDPGFRVLDAAESERVAREAFDEALEAFLAEGDPQRERTVAAFDVGGLRAIALGAHAELRSRGVAAPSLPEPPSPDVEGALRRLAAQAEATLAEVKESDPNRELVGRAALAASRSTPPDLEELVSLRSDSSARSMTSYCEAIDDAVARVAEAGEGGAAYRHLGELLELFSARFEAAKERRGALDFEDLQIRAVRLLERSDLGDSYRRRFSHLLVDEFQDTNRLQLRLIEALRGPGGELVVVGDELQSIYGFRHADIDVFRERRAAAAAGRDVAAMALSGNFRSRPEVIAAVNAIGEKLLDKAFRPLLVGAPPAGPAPPGHDGPAVELLLTGRDGWDEEGIELEAATDATTPAALLAEARFLAERLRALADAGVPRAEMVVLLRAFTHLDAYEDSLERAGLRPYVVGGRGYWSQQQVADVCALLATIANPLDDQAVFGALASPACGVSPDTLWLLRAASGRGRHVWPAVERLGGREEAELSDPERLDRIDAGDRALLRAFHATLESLRERAPRLPLAELIDSAVGETGYDLAVLGRSAGEGRFANVRKLMRLAAEFESHEGRDLRGLLDFLATRAEADVDGQAASAVEGHDGVRIMTVHSAKGLEFGVVAVPGLSRRLLAGARAPVLTIGREPDSPRVGMQLRRLGAPAINLYAHRELRDEAQGREAEEELRLFHVAATRARQRLILSGVAASRPARGNGPGKPIVERIVEAFAIDRERDSTVALPAPRPRAGLDAAFEPAEIAIRVSLASAERAAELTTTRAASAGGRDAGEGPAPLVQRRPAAAPNRPLSYTAIAAYEQCGYRFQIERVFELGEKRAADGRGTAAARGAAVHSLLEWSQAHGWREPPPELARLHATAAGLDRSAAADLLEPLRAWLGSDLFASRVAGARTRAEVPFLLEIDSALLRGSIDLLVEADERPPLVLDYKTDRLEGSTPAEKAGDYAVQRDLYALAVAEARDAARVEVAYVFLERADEPVVRLLDRDEIAAGRERLRETITRMAVGEFVPAPSERRDEVLCRGCPARNRLCAGPADLAHRDQAPSR